jgi:hypothetical protein
VGLTYGSAEGAESTAAVCAGLPGLGSSSAAGAQARQASAVSQSQ